MDRCRSFVLGQLELLCQEPVYIAVGLVEDKIINSIFFYTGEFQQTVRNPSAPRV